MRRSLLVVLATLLMIPVFATAASASASEYQTSPCSVFIQRNTDASVNPHVANASTYAYASGGPNPYCNSQVCAQIFADVFGTPTNSPLQCASAPSNGYSYLSPTAQALGNDSYSYHQWCTTSSCGTRWL